MIQYQNICEDGVTATLSSADALRRLVECELGEGGKVTCLNLQPHQTVIRVVTIHNATVEYAGHQGEMEMLVEVARIWRQLKPEANIEWNVPVSSPELAKALTVCKDEVPDISPATLIYLSILGISCGEELAKFASWNLDDLHALACAERPDQPTTALAG